MADLIERLNACGHGDDLGDVSYPFPIPLAAHDLFLEAARRIKELEGGACRFNCRNRKEAFLAGAEWGLDETRGPTLQTTAGAYNQWIKERE